MKTSLRIIVTIALYIGLAACATTDGPSITGENCKDKTCKSFVVSKPVPENSSLQYNLGVMYSLPTQFLEFSASRSIQTREKLAEDLATREKTVVEVNKAIAEQKTKTEELVKEHAQAQSEAAKAKLGLDVEIAKIKQLLLEQKLLTAKQEVTSGEQALANFDPASPARDTFELKVLPAVPDSKRRYTAVLNNSNTSSETYEIKTTTGGLLSGGKGKTEGKLDEIFVTLASVLGTINPQLALKSNVFEGPPQKPEQANDSCNAPDKASVKVMFHPSNLKSGEAIKSVQTALDAAKLCYSLIPNLDLPETQTQQTDSGFVDGLVYPVARTFEFQLTPKNIHANKLKFFYPTVIDSNNLGVLPLHGSLWGDNDFEYDFTDGMLTRYKSVTPNQLLSALSMIPEAGKAILSVPGELLKLKVDYSSQQKGYYEAQQAALTARLALESSLNTASIPDSIE